MNWGITNQWTEICSPHNEDHLSDSRVRLRAMATTTAIDPRTATDESMTRGQRLRAMREAAGLSIQRYRNEPASTRHSFAA